MLGDGAHYGGMDAVRMDANPFSTMTLDLAADSWSFNNHENCVNLQKRLVCILFSLPVK